MESYDEYRSLIKKKVVSNNFRKEKNAEFDKIIKRNYPDLIPYDQNRLTELKAQYDSGNKEALKEAELMMLSKAIDFLKNFSYIYCWR